MYSRDNKYFVLPPFRGQDSLIDAIDDGTKLEAERICDILDWYVDNIDIKDERIPLFPSKIIGDINVEQATNLLHHINKKFKVIGALPIPTLNSILFQTDFGDFTLRYGPPSGCYVTNFKFNIDHGFIHNNRRFYPPDEENHVQNVIKVLQDYFQKWNKNDRKGFVIQDENKISNENVSNHPFVPQETLMKSFNTGTWCGFFVRKVLPATAVAAIACYTATQYFRKP